MAMTRRDRLMATLRGQAVDRPAVCFYEIGGWKMEPNDDEFTVWNDPSWRPLVQMAHAETDLIRMVGPVWTGGSDNGLSARTTSESWREGDARFTRTTIQAAGRTLTSMTRQNKDTQTVWTTEHLLKNVDDVGYRLGLIGRVNIGEHRKANFAANFLQHAQSLIHAESAKTIF